MTWETVRLGEIARVDAGTLQPDRISAELPYVGLESIGRNGVIDESVAAGSADLKSAKNSFDDRHVLFGKLRPNLGKVARPSRTGVCSTDIYPLLPGDRVDRGYLAHYLLTAEAIAYSAGRATGVNLPRVSWSALADLPVPLPPLPEQRRIAAILDEADRARRLAARIVEQVREVGAATFVEMFSMPEGRSALSGLPRLSHHATLITDGEHLTPRRSARGHRLLSARNVRDGQIDTSVVDYVDDKEFERISRRCSTRRGDVLISCSGSVGRVAVVDTDEQFVMVRSVALVRPGETLKPQYLSWLLRSRSLQQQIQRSARSSAQANLFQQPIRDLRIIVPSIEEQLEFEAIIRRTDTLLMQHQQRARTLDALFASLQHRAFRGEL